MAKTVKKAFCDLFPLSNGSERYLAVHNVRKCQNMNVHGTFRAAFDRKSSGANVVNDYVKLIGVLSAQHERARGNAKNMP